MPHNPITLDILRALKAIDRHGSFAAAAEALNKVPSALTYTIQKVEQDLNLALFDRSGHKAQMTDAAKLLLREGQKILDQLDMLATNAKQVADGWEVVFTVVFDTTIDIAQLFPVIKEFQDVAPFVRVKLKEESLSGSWESIQNNHANLLIAPRIGLPLDTDHLETKEIGDMEFTLAVAQNHPLTTYPQPVAHQELSKFPVVVIPDSTTKTQTMSAGLSHQERHFYVPGMTEKIKAQVAGLGIGYLPKFRIQNELENGSLVEIQTADNRTSQGKLLLAWRKDNNGKALEWFIKRLSSKSLIE
ncbi:LysR family transcriptional regulator [Gynuella sunshinyii]|uniref:Transcriptional regulator n=1 Tax=Gynuella sunshinyii YC6258 TaxID=1445510 RepID=A0A0C5W483_9GAMM|nr:LysR family transcriptional regulator [Gynuella sunshinyii]AJQ97434.1 transcriptional regulator [Gynuella sunshinyii YC6258]